MSTLPDQKIWNQFWNRPQSDRFHHVSWSKRRVMQVLRPYAISGKKALDAGCGSGFFSAYFCDQGMQTVSLDYAEAALAAAREATSGRAQIIKADMLNDDLGFLLNQKFDLIFSDGLLEHFIAKDQDRIMSQWMKLLTDDGCLVTFVPNRWSPWELIRPFFMPGIEESPFVLTELIELHERNGLSVFERGGVNTLPFKLSPDKWFAEQFGMLLYVLARKKISNVGSRISSLAI